MPWIAGRRRPSQEINAGDSGVDGRVPDLSLPRLHPARASAPMTADAFEDASEAARESEI